jgi:hypothetical protein
MVVGYFGAYDELWAADQTKLSFVILFLWVVSTIAAGIWHYNITVTNVNYHIKIGWFLSESMLAVGMIGTVAGFLLMLGTTFSGINVSDTATLQRALSAMALGMSTALYTTLVGLISSLFLKSQLVNLEHVLDYHEGRDNADAQ